MKRGGPGKGGSGPPDPPSGHAYVMSLDIDIIMGRMIETSLTLDVVYIAQKCKLD